MFNNLKPNNNKGSKTTFDLIRQSPGKGQNNKSDETTLSGNFHRLFAAFL